MVNVLAQTAEAVQLGTQFVEQAGGFGGAVWLLSLVLLFIALLVGFYTWKIGIPNANAHRENSAKLADAISVMSNTTIETNTQVRASGTQIDDTQAAIRAMASCRAAECSALEKLATIAGVDVAGELGEIRGAMKAAAEIAGRPR
jgi:pilus assembly protein TadC